MAIAQTQIEHANSPAMTVSTTQCACKNSWNSERLDDVSGATDGAMSAGFIERPFRRPAAAAEETATETKTDAMTGAAR